MQTQSLQLAQHLSDALLQTPLTVTVVAAAAALALQHQQAQLNAQADAVAVAQQQQTQVNQQLAATNLATADAEAETQQQLQGASGAFKVSGAAAAISEQRVSSLADMIKAMSRCPTAIPGCLSDADRSGSCCH